MEKFYIEKLPSDVAMIMLGIDYKKGIDYYIVNDENTTSITGIDPATGERIESDDFALDIEDFNLIEDLIEDSPEAFDNSYKVADFGPWFFVTVIMSISIIITVIVLLYVGGVSFGF